MFCVTVLLCLYKLKFYFALVRERIKFIVSNLLLYSGSDVLPHVCKLYLMLVINSRDTVPSRIRRKVSNCQTNETLKRDGQTTLTTSLYCQLGLVQERFN